jgi:transcriptional regulator with XRE-family HTH domain
MDDGQEASLAAALAASMSHPIVTISHVMEYSGLSRNAVANILSGQTKRPKPRTLTLIAAAIATDAFTRERDRERAALIERNLMMAAGYADPTAQQARSLLEMNLYYLLASSERARAWSEVIELLRALPAGDVRRLPGLVDRQE